MPPVILLAERTTAHRTGRPAHSGQSERPAKMGSGFQKRRRPEGTSSGLPRTHHSNLFALFSVRSGALLHARSWGNTDNQTPSLHRRSLQAPKVFHLGVLSIKPRTGAQSRVPKKCDPQGSVSAARGRERLRPHRNADQAHRALSISLTHPRRAGGSEARCPLEAC